MPIIETVATSLFSYGMSKSWEHIFEPSQEYEGELEKVINKTVDDYSNKYPIKDSSEGFAFYKSQILLEEFLKFRLFEKEGHLLNHQRVEEALLQNPNIIRPTEQQLEAFFLIFMENVKSNTQLAKLEIEEFHKEKIYQIYSVLQSLSARLESYIRNNIGLLEKEYEEQLKECLYEIEILKPKTAIDRILRLEERMNRNAKHVSDQLRSHLSYLKAICLRFLDKHDETNRHYINAYHLSPENREYREKACFTYYGLGDNEYKTLMKGIESTDPYNAISWSIKTLEATNPIEYIKNSVPKIVLKNNRYKRLIFNATIKRLDIDRKEFHKALLISELQTKLPDVINQQNFDHWLFVANIFHSDLFHKNQIPFKGRIKKSEETVYLLDLLRILKETIERGELAISYRTIVFSYYWLQNEMASDEESLSKLEESYLALAKKDGLNTLLFANALQKAGRPQKAIEAIDNWQGKKTEELLALKLFCATDKDTTIDATKAMVSLIQNINSHNIDRICLFAITLISEGVISVQEIRVLLLEKNFVNPHHKVLLEQLINSFSQPRSVSKEDIEHLRAGLKGDSSLSFYISVLYSENEYHDECISFTRTIIDENAESRELSFFIKVLNKHKKSHQQELLRLLKLWRINFSFDDFFLRVELDLRRILQQWDEIYEITKYGLERLPIDEQFLMYHLVSLQVLGKTDEISSMLPKISSFDFHSTNNAVRAAHILINNGFLLDGVEMVYDKAINKNDSFARAQYFYLSSELDNEGIFQDYKVIERGKFVKYQIGSDFEMVYVDEETEARPLVANSLHKSIGETFTITRELSKKMVEVKIARITNKYLALLDEIHMEINKPFSSLPFESIRFEGDGIEGFNKALIENFGHSNAREAKIKEENLRKYYSYNFTFFELVTSNFGGIYIYGYYDQTSPSNNGFLIKPLKYQTIEIGLDQPNKVIDFTSGLLFYELSIELNLDFDMFVTTPIVFNMIDELIEEAERQTKVEISVLVKEDMVIPQFYDETFHTGRITKFKDVKRWFTDNSTPIIPNEKIDMIRPLYEEGKVNSGLEYSIDLTFLANRENSFLITDDLGFDKFLKLGNRTVSTERYLLYRYPDKRNELIAYLLSRKYIGLGVTSDDLYFAYIDQHLPDKGHVYEYALLNITLNQNYLPSTIPTVTDFLKKIALNALITKEKYRIDATNVFVLLIKGLPNKQLVVAVENIVQDVFFLLGEYQDISLAALEDAKRITRKGSSRPDSDGERPGHRTCLPYV